jgi:hypothetical protein
MLSGLLLMLLGIWGALIPFIGPYFHYAYTPDSAWTWTSGRLWLEVLPGAAAFVAGFLLTTTAHRAVGVFAGWLGSVAGAWFVLGPTFSRLWHGAGDTGSPVGGTTRQVLEQIGFFSGLGVVILFLAAQALGRFTVRSLRDVRAAETYATRTVEPAAAPTATATAAPVAPRRTLFGGNRAVQTDEAAPAGRTDTMVQPAARGAGAQTERVETRRDA